MLHLSGHDDRRPRDYKLMHAAEDDILTRLGLPAAFAAGNRVSS
jgi:ssRNA-specific RNase YbeY (16S rRNA maturation enzyme)